MDPKKIDDHTLEITKTRTTEEVVAYDYGFLKSQRAAVEAQKARDNGLRDAELAEIDALIADADALGITARPAEEVKQDAEAPAAEDVI